MKFRYAFLLLMLSLVIPIYAQRPAQSQPPQTLQHQDQTVVAQAVAIPRFQIITTSYDSVGGTYKIIILLDNQTGETWEYRPGIPTTKPDGTKGYVPPDWTKVER
jgi:hypothetical protein